MAQLSKDHSTHYTDESVNTATHMAGAVFALFAALLLVAKSVIAGKWWHVVAFFVYGFSLIALFVMSALHHGVNGSEKTNRRLRTLDYVAVYGLIVGTMTPVCLVLYRGLLGAIVLFVAAVAAAFGITMRSLYETLPSYVSLTLYLCLGWLPVLLLFLDGSVVSGGAIATLLMGGIFYSGGAIVFGLEKPNLIQNKFGFHEIWHIAVLLGALCHFLFMYHYVLPVA